MEAIKNEVFISYMELLSACGWDNGDEESFIWTEERRLWFWNKLTQHKIDPSSYECIWYNDDVYAGWLIRGVDNETGI